MLRLPAVFHSIGDLLSRAQSDLELGALAVDLKTETTRTAPSRSLRQTRTPRPLTPGGGNEAANCLGTACCDPTNTPGYPVAVAGGDNLLGSITHNQTIFPISGQITETKLFDDCHGEDINLVYLQNQCGALIGNGSHGGICNCPIE